jgi:DNA-binding transcriptional MerR regulator
MDKLTTTGQTSGILLISNWAIWRFVRDFNEFFSETAKQKAGRRYTEQDRRTLRAIRNLYRLGKKTEEIRESLKNGEELSLPGYELEDIAEIYFRVDSILKEMTQEAGRAEKFYKSMESMTSIQNLQRTVTAIIESDGVTIAQIKTQLKQLQSEVEELKKKPKKFLGIGD